MHLAGLISPGDLHFAEVFMTPSPSIRIGTRPLRILVVTLAIVAAFAGAGEADPVLDLTVDYNTPIVGPLTANFGFYLFTSPSNTWATLSQFVGSTGLTSAGAVIGPGSTTFEAPLPVDLSNVYLSGYGAYLSGPGLSVQSIFVIEPPSGNVPDVLAYEFGPPWTSLATLTPSDPLSGTLFGIYGYSNQPGGTYYDGTWEAREVPEPSSVVLMGIGLCGLMALGCRRKRQSTFRRCLAARLS